MYQALFSNIENIVDVLVKNVFNGSQYSIHTVVVQVSISSTFYARVFHTKVLFSSYVLAKKVLSRMDEIITTVSSQKKNQNNITKITSYEFCDVMSSQKTCDDITSQSN